MSIEVLDCTLRDGGYINDWKFGQKTIVSILDRLERARIDIIECGFLTKMVQDSECSLFVSAEAAAKVLPKRRRNAMFVAMIAIGEKELHPLELSPRGTAGIDGIRLTFHREEIDQACQWAQIIMEKGYEVFMQPVGTVFYSDMELLQLVERMNELKPYAFYIVDTLGSMYRNDVSHRFYLIDKNMHPSVRLGFHGHNNLQLAFSNAQILGKIQTKRTLILDSSVYGMGRGAGNLPTELITQYINRNIASRYDVTMVMDIYDEYISAIRKTHEWGYSMPYHIAATNVCHPNYATYLLNRQTLTMKDIEKIIRLIPGRYRILFDKKLIEQLYAQYQSRKIDDSSALTEISQAVAGKKLLLLAPGKSLITHYHEIRVYIEKEQPYVISINFVDAAYNIDACFASNHKRMDIMKRELSQTENVRVIVTSNIQECEETWLYVDYDSYTNSDELISDNAGLMLLKLLKQCGAQQAALAGFDGYDARYSGNYYSREMDLPKDSEEIKEKQQRMRAQLRELAGGMELSFVTPSAYEEA